VVAIVVIALQLGKDIVMMNKIPDSSNMISSSFFGKR